MTSIPIGLELYSVRHQLAEDLRGTIEAVAKMGYAGVEFFGAPQHSAAALKAMLDDAGLVCCGWHTPVNLVQDEKLEETIAFNKVLQNDKIIIPGLPAESRQTIAQWREWARFFNRLADKLAPHAMVTGYHNHHAEFLPIDGEIPYYVFFDATDERVVMQLDNGHAFRVGVDVATVIRRYPGRATTVHLKPYSLTIGAQDEMRGYDPIIGAPEDELPWADFFDACEEVGATEWYIVEYESDAHPALEAVDLCLQGLRAMGK